MAKKSIGSLHADVTANASQFISEFKRADNESRRSAAAINGQVDKLTKDLKKKFQLADFGKDILRGAGLFGGMQIAQEAAAQIVGYWERAANAAKEIEMASSRSLDATLKTLSARQDDATKLENMRKNMEELKRIEAEMLTPKFSEVSYVGREGERRTTRTPLSETNDQAIARAQNSAAINELNSKIKDIEGKVVDSRLTEFFAGVAVETQKSAQKIDDALSTFFGDVARESENSAQKVDDALATFFGDIARESDESAQKVDDALATFFGDIARESEKSAQRIDDALTTFFGDVARESEAKATAWSSGMAAMWENVADRAGQSFADILISGENTFGNLVDIVARSVVEMAARLAIINPLINGLFGLSGAAVLPAFYGAGAAMPGRAMGGGVDAGVTYRVNEQGQEFFKSNTGGTIIPAGIAANMAGKSGGGDSYAFNYNFATGVTKAELAPLLALNQRQTLAQLADIRRRGGAAARAY